MGVHRCKKGNTHSNLNFVNFTIPSSQIERKLAAIMFTDIAGYTALSAKDENKALELLDKQQQILTPIIEEFNGTLHNKVGDGLLLTFPTVTDAVKCGIKIQLAIKEVEDLNLRIGIHEGEITFKDGDALGDDVNVASRIDPFAADGGIVISGKVQQNISSLPEYKTKFISQPSLRGVRQEVKIFCITSHGLPETDITKITAKLEKDVKKLWFNQKSIIKVIVILSVLTIGIILWISNNNEISQIINKKISTQDKKQPINSYFSDKILVNELITDIKTLDSKKYFWNHLMDFDTSLIYSSVSDSIYSILDQEILSGIISLFPGKQVVTFEDVKKSFAKQGKIIGRKDRVVDYFQDNNYYQKNNLPHPWGFGIYIYNILSKNNKSLYSLIMEYKIKGINGFDNFIGDKNKIIYGMLLSIEKINKLLMKIHPIAIVDKIKNESLIISLLEENHSIRNGTILKGIRKYGENGEGYDDISDEGVQLRIRDLQELHDCFKINSTWNDSINDQYNWTYNEYNDLYNKGYIKYKATNRCSFPIGIFVKIDEVFDSTASAIIIEREYPKCIKMKVGDLLYLK